MYKYIKYVSKLYQSWKCLSQNPTLNLFTQILRRGLKSTASTLLQVTTFTTLHLIDSDPDSKRTLCLQNEENLDIIIEMADNAVQDGQWQDAETILMVALKLAEANHMEEIVCYVYDKLINISYTVGDYQNAKNLIDAILARLIKTGMAPDDDMIITFKLKLARLHGHTGNIDTADELFRDCLCTQKRKLDTGPLTDKTGILYIDLLFWYGVFLFQLDHFQEAFTNIQTAYQYSNKIQGVNAAQELVILSILAEIQCALEDYDGAIINLTNAIVIGKTINHPELALTYVLLGNIYLKKQMYKEAKQWCAEGRKLAKFNENPRIVAAAKSCMDKIRQDIELRYEKEPEHA